MRNPTQDFKFFAQLFVLGYYYSTTERRVKQLFSPFFCCFFICHCPQARRFYDVLTICKNLAPNLPPKYFPKYLLNLSDSVYSCNVQRFYPSAPLSADADRPTPFTFKPPMPNGVFGVQLCRIPFCLCRTVSAFLILFVLLVFSVAVD